MLVSENISYFVEHLNFFFTSRRARGRLVLRLLCHFRVCISAYLCIRTYHVRNNYVTYIVAMRPSTYLS